MSLFVFTGQNLLILTIIHVHAYYPLCTSCEANHTH